jgi:Domain of unknown function (DUF4352)
MTFNKFLLVFNFFTLTFLSCKNSEDNKYEKPIKEFSIGQIDYKIYNKSYGTNVSKDGSQLDTSGGYFLQVNLGITNKTNQPIKFDTSMFRLTNSSGRTFSFSNNMNEFFSSFDTSLNAVEIQPNMTKHGFIIFNVPTTDEYVLELNNGSWTKEKSSFVVKPVD